MENISAWWIHQCKLKCCVHVFSSTYVYWHDWFPSRLQKCHYIRQNSFGCMCDCLSVCMCVCGWEEWDELHWYMWYYVANRTHSESSIVDWCSKLLRRAPKKYADCAEEVGIFIGPLCKWWIINILVGFQERLDCTFYTCISLYVHFLI